MIYEIDIDLMILLKNKFNLYKKIFINDFISNLLYNYEEKINI